MEEPIIPFNPPSRGDQFSFQDIQNIIADYLDAYATKNQYGLSKIPYHSHTGSDSPRIDYRAIDNTPNDWQFTGTFSSTGSQTVSWTAGTFTNTNGSTFSIIAGNTGVMTALTYIYFDNSASITTLQTTITASSARGNNKTLLAIANIGSLNTQGTTIFTDNFNSYSDGTILGQGSWTTPGTINEVFDVEATTVYEGAKAVRSNNSISGVGMEKTGTLLNDGAITFYIRRDPLGVPGEVSLKETTVTKIVKIEFVTGSGDSGGITYRDSGNNTVVISSTMTASVWYEIQIQWRSSDHKVRYCVNGGTFTSWVAPLAVWTTGIDTLLFAFTSVESGLHIYIDSIQQYPVYGNATFQVFGGSGGVTMNNSNLIVTQLSDITPVLGTVTSGTLSGITSVALRDTSAGFDVTVTPTSSTALTAGRTLTLDIVNAAHTLKFGGNLTIANDLITSGNNSLTLTTTGTTNVTVPLSGTLVSTVATIDTTGLTANVGASTLYVVPATGEGMYEVNAYVVETIAGSISSTLPNVQVVYTDKDTNDSVTLDVTPVLGVAGIGQTGALTSNTIGTVDSGTVPMYVKASTTIQYQTVNYASTAAGMTYALRIRLEKL